MQTYHCLLNNPIKRICVSLGGLGAFDTDTVADRYMAALSMVRSQRAALLVLLIARCGVKARNLLQV